MQHSRLTKTPYFHTYVLSTPRDKYRMDGVVCSRNGTWRKLSIKNKQTKINKQCFSFMMCRTAHFDSQLPITHSPSYAQSLKPRLCQ